MKKFKMLLTFVLTVCLLVPLNAQGISLQKKEIDVKQDAFAPCFKAPLIN